MKDPIKELQKFENGDEDAEVNEALLSHLEETAKNLETLAKELDARDRLDKSFAPRGQISGSQKAKFMGIPSASDDGEEMTKGQLLAGLAVQNSDNVRALAKAAGVDRTEIEDDDGAATKTEFFGLGD